MHPECIDDALDPTILLYAMEVMWPVDIALRVDCLRLLRPSASASAWTRPDGCRSFGRRRN